MLIYGGFIGSNWEVVGWGCLVILGRSCCLVGKDRRENKFIKCMMLRSMGMGCSYVGIK